MLDSFSKFNLIIAEEPIFWFCALSGSGLFLIQLLLSFLGGDSDIDEGGSELDLGKFKWMSKQALTGFLMMFGWVGLTCRKEFDLSLLPSLAFSCVGGVIAIVMTGFIFRTAKKLHSPGTVFSLEEAIGKNAMIYQRIPKGGVGKITVSLHHFTHEIDAISLHQEELDSFTTVQIIKKANDTTVVVVPSK